MRLVDRFFPPIIAERNLRDVVKQVETIYKITTQKDYGRLIREGFRIPLREAAAVVRIPHSTLKFWIHEGVVGRFKLKGRKSKGRILLSYPDLIDIFILKDLVEIGFKLKEAEYIVKHKEKYLKIILTSVLYEVDEFYCELSWRKDETGSEMYLEIFEKITFRERKKMIDPFVEIQELNDVTKYLFKISPVKSADPSLFISIVDTIYDEFTNVKGVSLVLKYKR